MKYTEPMQNSKGMWVVEVTREDGFTVEIKTTTTKKAMIEWLKGEKKKCGE